MNNQQCNNLEELQSMMKDWAASPDASTRSIDILNKLKSLCGAEIRVNVENGSDDVVRRVQLTTLRVGADLSKTLNKQANGVIFDTNWNILVRPTNITYNKLPMNFNKSFDKYKVYKINDGTQVNLYYFNEWCISTMNGINVSDYKVVGDETFKQVFAKLAAIYNLSFDNFDKSHSYSIGFHYHLWHPLVSETDKMWFIQSSGKNPGLPCQEQIYENYSTLQQNNTVSLENFLNSDKSARVINYGYILRTDCENHADYIMESSLLKKIRQLFYDLPKKRDEHFKSINSSNRAEYFALRSYLNFINKYLFVDLFPIYSGYYHKYDNIFDKLAFKVLQQFRESSENSKRMKNRKTEKLSLEETKSEVLPNVIDPQKQLINQFVTYCINNKCNIDSREGKSIVSDLIKEYDYVDMYFTMYSN